MVVEEMARARFTGTRAEVLTKLSAATGSRFHTVRQVVDGAQSANMSMVFRLAHALGTQPHLLTWRVQEALADVESQETADAAYNFG